MVTPGPPHRRAVEAGHDVAAACAGGQLHAQLPALPRLVDPLQPVERALGDLRLRRDLLAARVVEVADELVGLAAALHLRLALERPFLLPLHARAEDVS